MKALILFIISFAVLSVMPFLWNEFQFVEFGFPFIYLERSVVEIPGYSQSVNLYNWSYLIYDVILVALLLWLFTKLTQVIKRKTSL